jgi:hypothetical protein
VLAYAHDGEILLARAPPGAPFAAATRVARVTRGWTSYSQSVAVSPAGDVLVAWVESSNEPKGFDRVCGFVCHARVLASVAHPGTPFGAPEVVSALGTTTDSAPVTAVSSSGARLVAWTDGPMPDEGPLVAAVGNAAADVEPVPDHKRPRVTASIALRALRAAARGEPLRVRIACSEACAVRFQAYSRADPAAEGLFALAPVVISRSGATLGHWQLDSAQRRELRRLLRTGRFWLPVVASDRAGNLRYTSATLR